MDYWSKPGAEVSNGFFAKLYTESGPEGNAGTLLRGRFPTISLEAYMQLVEPFTTEEVQAAVSSMGLFKAPGLDGFQALFYQRYWDLIGDHVCAMALKVLQGQQLPEKLNNT